MIDPLVANKGAVPISSRHTALCTGYARVLCPVACFGVQHVLSWIFVKSPSVLSNKVSDQISKETYNFLKV